MILPRGFILKLLPPTTRNVEDIIYSYDLFFFLDCFLSFVSFSKSLVIVLASHVKSFIIGGTTSFSMNFKNLSIILLSISSYFQNHPTTNHEGC